MLQQYLPLAVLKLAKIKDKCIKANVLLQQYLPLAVLKLDRYCYLITGPDKVASCVATVLTACGIETATTPSSSDVTFSALQQYLPLAVLKLEV